VGTTRFAWAPHGSLISSHLIINSLHSLSILLRSQFKIFSLMRNSSLLSYIALPHSFIHSFIHSFGHFYSAPSSPQLLRGAPDYSTDTVSEFCLKVYCIRESSMTSRSSRRSSVLRLEKWSDCYSHSWQLLILFCQHEYASMLHTV